MTFSCLSTAMFSLFLFGHAPPSIDHTLPPEVVDATGAPLDPMAPITVNPLDSFDDFSWQSFIALNWPAKADVRGIPDPTKSLGDAGPRVWETWKTGYEIVPQDLNPPDPTMPMLKEPTEWTSFDSRTPDPAIPRINSGKVRLLASWKPFADFNQVGFGEADLKGPLVCQNHTYTRYEVRVNKEEFDFIRTKKLYLRSAIDGLAAPLRFTDGSIEVKGAWRELEPSMTQAEVDTYYHIEAKVFDSGTMSSQTKRMGLVGLHIVHKTPLRPQWVWSSFEHIKNVPPQGVIPAMADRFSYNNPAKAQATDPVSPPITPANPPVPMPVPTQVIRARPLATSPGTIGTAATNARYQEVLPSPWNNYMLVVTQWPTQTTDPMAIPPDNFLGKPFPAASTITSIANTTMETYTQSGLSCMHCHNVARAQKLDFVFFIDFHAFNDTALAGAKPRVGAQLKVLLDAVSDNP